MDVFGRTLGWLEIAGASILRTPVEIAQRHKDVVCLMLEEDCSSSFLPSKILGADEAAMFIVTVVVMVLVKWRRRGGRFLQDHDCDENGADEDAEDEEDAAAAAAAAQEAAEENERVVTLEEENSTLRSLNERVDGEVSALRDQRELAEDALALASHHSRDQQRDHAQEVQLLEGVNQEVLGQVDEERRQRIVFEGAVEAQREEHRNQVAAMQRRRQAELASERQQHQENLDQAHELLATRNRDNEVLVEQAAAAERTVEEMRREREAEAMAATQLQQEQQLAAVRLSEQNQARLAAGREELATSDNEKAEWTQRATVAEGQVAEMRREREAAATAATQLQQEQQLVAVRLSEQNQARLAAVREELATSDNEKAEWTQRATVAECQVEEMRRAEEDRAAIADTKFERLEKDVEAAALRQGHLRAELDTKRTAEETGQRETPTFNADVNETSTTSSKVQQHRLAGYEEMATHTKPLVAGVKAWSDKSVIITIDNCGNCYQSSWFLVTILWAVQCPQRLRELIIKLLRGYAQAGALVHVPPHYQRYVEAVFLFLMTTQKCWGYHTSFPENDDGGDDFGIKQAIRIVEILQDVRGLATGTVEGGCNEDSLGLQLKRGMAIVARAFDVSWANRNGFPDMDVVATLHQSMEFDTGLQLTLIKSARDAVGDPHHPPSTLPPYVPQDIMRPACSLGYIVGMAMDDMGNNGHANRTDLTDTYASIATEAAEAQGRPNHSSITGMLVWKASCPHYNVHVQSGALANALASTFGLDLSEGDAVASAELREGSRWQRENAMGIAGAIDPDELALLITEARTMEADASNPQGSSAAAAAPASSPASVAAANRSDAQWRLPGTNGDVHASSEPWTTRERKRKKKKKKNGAQEQQARGTTRPP